MKPTAILSLCLLSVGHGFVSHAPALRSSSLYRPTVVDARTAVAATCGTSVRRPQQQQQQQLGRKRVVTCMGWGDDIVWTKVGGIYVDIMCVGVLERVPAEQTCD